MKKTLIILGTIILFLFGFMIFGFMIYNGLFKSITVTEKEIGPFKLVYKEHKGDYSKAGIISNKVYEILKEKYKIETKKGFGIYYDDPRKIQKEQLRSEIGCIIEPEDYDKTKQIKDDFLIKDFVLQNSVYAEFPLKNKLSILFGILRVYPKIKKYIVEKGYSPSLAIEIYDVPNKKAIYAFPIIDKSLEEKN